MLSHQDAGPNRSKTLALILALSVWGTAAIASPTQEISGKIASVDPDNGSITIEVPSGEAVSVKVVDETRIMVAGKAGALLDVKAGAVAKVTLMEAAGDASKTKVAQSITVP